MTASDTKPKEPFFKRWEGILVIALPLIGASLAGAYTIGKDVGEKDLDVYKSVKQLDLSTLTANSITATSLLNETVVKFQDVLVNTTTYAAMKRDLASANDKVAQSAAQLVTAQQKLSVNLNEILDLKATLKGITPKGENYNIKLGESKSFTDAAVVGLTSWFDNFVTLNTAGSNDIHHVGDKIKLEDPFLNCVLVLDKILADKSVSVRVSCTPILSLPQ